MRSKTWKILKINMCKIITKRYFILILKLSHYFAKTKNVMIRRKLLRIFFVPSTFLSSVSCKRYFRQEIFKILFRFCWAPMGKRILQIRYLGEKKFKNRKTFRLYVTRRALQHIKKSGRAPPP